jgi:hypothetical protein
MIQALYAHMNNKKIKNNNKKKSAGTKKPSIVLKTPLIHFVPLPTLEYK